MVSSGSRRSSAAVRDDAPGAAAPRFHQPAHPEPVSLGDQVSEAGPPAENLIDLLHEGPGPGDVSEHEVDADELDPGLDRQLGHRVSQQVPQALGRDKRFPGRRRISPVQGRTGLGGTDQRRRVAFVDPGPAQHGGRLVRERSGAAPFTVCHRQQRPLGQGDR